MSIGLHARISQSDRIAARVIGGRAVVIVIDEQTMHTLDELGTFVWSRAQGRTVREIVEGVVEEFEVTAEDALPGVLSFLEQLRRVGAVTVEEQP